MPESQSSKRRFYTWALDDKQIAAFEAWRDKIWKTDKQSPGAIGGTFTFKITGTTIGTTGTKCQYRRILILSNALLKIRIRTLVSITDYLNTQA